MTKKNPDDSVRDEQFDIGDASIENSEKIDKKPDSVKESSVKKEAVSASEEESDISFGLTVNDEVKPLVVKIDDIVEEHSVIEQVESEEVSGDMTVDESENSSIDEIISGDQESVTDVSKSTDSVPSLEESSENSEISVNIDELEELPKVDYSKHTKSELVETVEILIENRPPAEIRDDIEKIKVYFYKLHKLEYEKLRSVFVEEGGSIEDFKALDDSLEIKMRNLLAKYRGRRTEFSKQIEAEKQENLRKKYEIIDRIKDLVNREESINKTFQEFRELQNNWHSMGPVPQSSLKNLWETYNHNVEIFYDFIKINQELRDLDFKKNLEKKIILCEKADELLLEPNPVNAFRKLQDYHQRWREIGPVPREARDAVWERFKDVTSEINRKHHEYFESLKDDQKKNLGSKTALCEKIEEINQLSISSFKEWEDKAKQVIELQKVWRTIGFAPKKQNNQIYQRFREACDKFFLSKRSFYSENKDLQMENLQKKAELCLAAEALQDSADWKETTDTLIKLQKEWKEVGAVPRKHSDKIWKRFRKACDHFFSKKSAHFSDLDSSFDENLKLKEALIQKLETFDPGSDYMIAFEKLKEIQKDWAEIGFVPFKSKDDITNRYRDALNKQFDHLKIGDEQKEIFKYKSKLANLRETPQTSRKIRTERDKFVLKIKQIESDLVLWENNIGFFSKSSNADAMIKEVEDKIENARNSVQVLEEKIRLIDRSGLDD